MAMKPKQYMDFLRRSLADMPHRAIFVQGPVGVGKSECTKQVVDELGWEFTDIRLSLLDATDLRGLPAIDKEKRQTIWTKPAFLPDENDTKNRVLFFDEFNTSNKSMQNACLQLMLDRKIGEYKLPKNTRVLAAGNRVQDVGGFVSRQSPALNNRFVHVEFGLDFDNFKEWGYKHNIHPMVMGFLNFKKGDGLHKFKEDVDNTAFPSPRTWAFLGVTTAEGKCVLDLGLENSTLKEAIKGTIGEGTGMEFIGFLDIHKDLPSPEDILLKGKDIMPKKSNVLYALCSSLIRLTLQHRDKVDRLIDYAMLIEKEFAVVLVKDLLKTELKEKVMASKSFNKFIDKFEDLLFEDLLLPGG